MRRHHFFGRKRFLYPAQTLRYATLPRPPRAAIAFLDQRNRRGATPFNIRSICKVRRYQRRATRDDDDSRGIIIVPSSSASMRRSLAAAIAWYLREHAWPQPS